jgi:predicted extracellular nuclease
VSLDPATVQTVTDSAFDDSRRPLSAVFQFAGKRVRVVNVHLGSKGGSDPLFGRQQPPRSSSDETRVSQVQALKRHLRARPANDADHLVVLGDFNAFSFEQPLLVATQGGEPLLVDMVTTLPPAERWSYVFEGNSQALDHILVDAARATHGTLTIFHVNAGGEETASDHDPSVLRLRMP